MESEATDQNIAQLEQVAVVRVLSGLKLFVVVTILGNQHGSVHKRNETALLMGEPLKGSVNAETSFVDSHIMLVAINEDVAYFYRLRLTEQPVNAALNRHSECRLNTL